jgi:hypothetical protein
VPRPGIEPNVMSDDDTFKTNGSYFRDRIASVMPLLPAGCGWSSCTETFMNRRGKWLTTMSGLPSLGWGGQTCQQQRDKDLSFHDETRKRNNGCRLQRRP